jgi:hypothetical protein
MFILRLSVIMDHNGVCIWNRIPTRENPSAAGGRVVGIGFLSWFELFLRTLIIITFRRQPLDSKERVPMLHAPFFLCVTAVRQSVSIANRIGWEAYSHRWIPCDRLHMS